MKEYPFTPGNFYSKGYTREGALQSVGEGWASLINEAFDKIEVSESFIVVDQVKEKYGGLRIYTSPYDATFDKVIEDIERRSFEICELCGAAGKLRGGSWYQTRCEEHANGRTPILPF